MNPEPPDPNLAPPPRRWRVQFGLRSLLLLMLVCGIASAGLGGLLRGSRAGQDEHSLMPFVLLTVAAPMAVLVIAGLVHAVGEFLDQRKR